MLELDVLLILIFVVMVVSRRANVVDVRGVVKVNVSMMLARHHRLDMLARESHAVSHEVTAAHCDIDCILGIISDTVRHAAR